MARFDELYHNRAVRAFAAKHGFRTTFHPDNKVDPEYQEVIVPCPPSMGGGYWWGRGEERMGFYHPSRQSPKRDMTSVKALCPAVEDASGEDETYFFASHHDAALLASKGPAWCRARYKTAHVQTPEHREASRKRMLALNSKGSNPA
jgi:hypothetical protein